MLPQGTAKKYVEYLNRFRYAIVVFWVVMDILGLLYGLKFFDATTTEFVAPPGSDALQAQDKLIKYFPDQKDNRNAVVYITSYNEASVFDGDLGDKLDEFSRELKSSLSQKSIFLSYASYYDFMDQDLPLLAASFRTNSTDTATYISIRYDGKDRDESMDYIDKISRDVNHISEDLGLKDLCKMSETGVDYFQKDTLEGTQKDMETMDTMVLPIALLVLACVIQNLPIMFVPLVSIATTLLMDVVAFVPSFMMSLTFAMSIDYSLFLLSRFCEEHRLGRPILDCIELMLESAGGTIAVSGGTLMICFLGLIFIPMDLISSVGVGSAFVLAVAICANLTLTPAVLIMSEPVVFWLHSYVNLEKLPWVRHVDHGPPPKLAINNDDGAKLSDDKGNMATPLMLTTTYESDAYIGSISNDAVGNAAASKPPGMPHDDVDDMEEVQSSMWYKMGSAILSKWTGLALFVIVIAVTMPINIYCLDVKTTISFDAMVPHSASSFKTYKDIGNTFGQGTVMQYRVLFVNRNKSESIFSDSGYTRAQSVITEMTNSLDYTQYKNFLGSIVIDSQNVSYQDTIDAINNTTDSTDETYVILADTYNSEPTEDDIVRATYVLFSLDIDPYSLDGVDWLKDCRDLLHDMQSKYGFDIYLVYGATITYDAVAAVYAVFPLVIAITLIVVFVFMSIAFLSIVAPLRLVGTIILTLTFCYGLAVLVYQKGAFEGMHQSAFNDYDALDWLPPIMCFSIVVGLGLDYDVFLVGRVLEYRLIGYTSDGSILKGLYKTGHIITAAGIIMAVAFSGLFLSEELILNQVAFFLVFAVLLDTFVVRTVLVPILMGMAGKHAWWPRPNVPDGTNNYGFQE